MWGKEKKITALLYVRKETIRNSLRCTFKDSSELFVVAANLL